jgi:hypothetical protein
LVASELSSVDGEFSARDDDVNEVHQSEGTQNNPANDKDKLSEVASNGVDCEEDGTSLSNNSDETESEEDYPGIKVTEPNVGSFSSNESPDNDKNYSLNDANNDNDDDEDYVEIIPKSSKASRPKSTTNILFTTGLGFNAKKQSELRTVVESTASKDEFSQAFKPAKDLYCLVFRWARKPPYHLAADIMNSNAVVAREAGLSSPFHLCQLRGWIITRRNPKSSLFHIQYKRFHECLTNAKFPVGHKALNLNGMIQKVYTQLDTCVLPSPTSTDQPATTKK